MTCEVIAAAPISIQVGIRREQASTSEAPQRGETRKENAMSTLRNRAYPIRSLENAPERSREPLTRLRASVGMIPNLAGAMANAPQLIEAFVAFREAFQRTSFSPQEKEVLALSNAVENGCRYCEAIHATFARGAGLDAREVERIRSGEGPSDARLAALSAFTRSMIRSKGRVSAEERQRFLAAGFRPEQMLELIVGLALSTLANYSGHITEPEPDEPIRANYR